MILLFINFMLAFMWAALTGNTSLDNLFIGYLLGFGILYLFRRLYPGQQIYFVKGFQAVRLLIVFLWELLIANLRVARDVLTPGPLRARPRVVAMPTVVEGEIPLLLLSNQISLTPGTLLLDISDDRKTIFLHVIDAPDPEQIKREIKQTFERETLELFSQQPAEQENGRELDQ
ncbi:MAG: Na+/H+ antiporter subunit E [Chloroflexi bacterium]|nr:Na+/H+ antiporter subunit E [Chloroflexota bacterium]